MMSLTYKRSGRNASRKQNSSRNIAITVAIVFAIGGASTNALAQGQPQVPEPGDPAAIDPVDGTNDIAEGNSAVGGPGIGPNANLRVLGKKRNTGFRLTEDGKSRAHVGLDAGIGFDVNPYSVPLQNMVSLQGFAGDALVRMRPRVGIEYPGSLIAVDADATLDYGFYPGILQLANIGAPTRNFFITRTQLGAGFEVNRNGMFSFALRDNFSFNNDPAFLTPGSTFMSVNNNLQGGLSFRPGGGTLKFKLGARFGIQKYLDIPRAIPQSVILLGPGSPINVFDLDNINGGFNLRTDWRFLPKTGVFGEVGAGVHIFPFRPILTQANGPPVQFPVYVRGGIMGQFTSKISGLASIGYTNPVTIQNVGGAINFDSLLFLGLTAQVEGRWAITNSTYLSGGFVRRVTPTPLYQHLTNNRLYLNFSQTIGRALVIRMNTGASFLMFGRDLTATTAGDPLNVIGQSSRFDGHFDMTADISYFLFDWLSFGLVNDFDLRGTTASTASAGGTGPSTNFSFVRNETMLMTSLHY